MAKRFLRAAALAALLSITGCQSWCDRHYGVAHSGVAGYAPCAPCCVPCCCPPAAPAPAYTHPATGPYNQPGPACACPPPANQ